MSIFDKGLIIGSRAFGVEQSESDFDVAFHVNDMPSPFTKENLTFGAGIEHYFHLVPPFGRGWKLSTHVELDSEAKDVKIDCLFFDDQRSLDQLSQVISELRKYPRFILEKKSLRVSLFEAHLENLGWHAPEFDDEEIPY